MNCPDVIDIVKSDYLGEYKIRIKFSDDFERIIDFKPFLTNAENPMTRKYLDLKYFLNLRIDYGDLVWDDYELCFQIANLYEGKI